MLDVIKAIILGIVEGITEFLPISSTGHLILVNEFIKMSQSTQFTDMFNVVIQLGAIMAVVVLYFHKLNPLSPRKTAIEKNRTWVLWFKVIVAVLPSVVLGLLLNDWMDAHLMNWAVVAAMLLVYGVLFIVIENWNANRRPRFTDLNTLPYQTALIIGMFQLLSLVPGTSRSGATILGAILIGASRYVATEFSFFLAIPTMFGASLLKVYKYFAHGGVFTGLQTVILATGMIVSFVVAYLAIRFLLNYIKNNNFKVFGWYRIVLSLIVIVYFGFMSK
ncbi:MAG: undecaprenyl-diphosphate phosphatase [Lentilactobacillus diolivorans]|jgi:undecaprenyl-diphosphatase|uniref:undecaprenyl-diphosphate phosphatase n=1 Tax=Lentilactobacillus diolivorans TaxID=179838 RepID=UPI000FEF03F6|nr:undecaprenyl-diphosphate phosphatase [Lentilactobacillus diolivorans]MCH4163741.1 undecaprenyl-diphosphate phosphatase [Lentilactobacillus diolivorans]MDH5105472.1 undecaprenyl-diphosphate phosphatase [Lentilactobacillus diolivorans]RRG03320.1 MAG: undecaprenyl-diphosphate phosphatase [Lactobacillus sp.]